MKWEKLHDWALNLTIGWEHLLISLWRNMLILSTSNEKRSFSKNKKIEEMVLFSFLSSFFLKWEFGYALSHLTMVPSFLQDTADLKVLFIYKFCAAICKRHQINYIQSGCISGVSLLLTKTLTKIKRQAEHCLLFLKHVKGEKIRLWHWNTALVRDFI